DLSMGTQDFVSRRGYITNQSGVFSNEETFRKRTLSLSASLSHPGFCSSAVAAHPHRSHPVAPFITDNHTQPRQLTPPQVAVNSPSTDTISGEIPGSKSPLKLFANRDTFTNNKLLRVLSHFEAEDLDVDAEKDPIRCSKSQKIRQKG